MTGDFHILQLFSLAVFSKDEYIAHFRKRRIGIFARVPARERDRYRAAIRLRIGRRAAGCALPAAGQGIHHQRKAGKVRRQHRRFVLRRVFQRKRGDQRLHLRIQRFGAFLRHGDHHAHEEPIRLHGQEIPLAARVRIAPTPGLGFSQGNGVHALVGKLAARFLRGEQRVAAAVFIPRRVEDGLPGGGDFFVLIEAVHKLIAVGLHAVKIAVQPQKIRARLRPCRGGQKRAKRQQRAQKAAHHWMVLMS